MIFTRLKAGMCNRNMYINYTYIYLYTNSFSIIILNNNNEYIQQELLDNIKCLLIADIKFLYLVT